MLLPDWCTGPYCSPEWRTHGQLDRRSDVCSVGVILFEALTGKPSAKAV